MNTQEQRSLAFDKSRLNALSSYVLLSEDMQHINFIAIMELPPLQLANYEDLFICTKHLCSKFGRQNPGM